MKRFFTTQLPVLLILSLLVLRAPASQVQGHLYFAYSIKEANPSMAQIIKGDGDTSTWGKFYKLGALAPDSAWLTRVFTEPRLQSIVLPNLKVPNFGMAEPINCSHNDHALQLCLNMLQNCSNRIDAAYALGWITHWVADSNTHGLINDWGGYFYNLTEGLWRHKLLEALESKYVLSVYGARLIGPGYAYLPELSSCGPDAALGGVSNLLLRAFATTYPTNANFQGKHAAQFLQAFLFGEGLAKKQGWLYFKESKCRNAQELDQVLEKITTSAITEGLAGLDSSNIVTLAKNATHLPTDDVFLAITNPLLATISCSSSQLVIQALTTDNKMYGRFLLEWEQAAAKAITDSKSVMPACVEYLQEHLKPAPDRQREKDLLRDIAQALKAINPCEQMDMPAEDYQKRLPPYLDTRGYPTAKDAVADGTAAGLAYLQYGRDLYNLTNLVCSGSVAGQKMLISIPIPPPDGLTWGRASAAREQVIPLSSVGQVAIPLSANTGEFAYDLIIGPKLPGLREPMDCITLKGKGDTREQEVMLGDFFTADVPAPAVDVTNAPFMHRWVTVAPYRRFRYGDMPLLRDNASDYMWGAHGQFRLDLDATERSATPRTSATLQFTHVNCHLNTDHQSLALVSIPDGIGTSEQAFQAESDKELALTEKLTPEIAAKWVDLYNQYEGEVKAMNLPEDERLDLLRQKQIDLYQDLGIDIGLLNMNRRVSRTGIRIVAPLLQAPVPAGWTETPDGDYLPYSDAWYTTNGEPACLMRTVKRERHEKKGEREILSAAAQISINFGNNPQIEKALAERLANQPDLQRRAFAAGDFKGTLFERIQKNKTHRTFEKANQATDAIQTEDSISSSTTGYGILKKGKVLLCITYSHSGYAEHLIQFTDQQFDEHHELISAIKREVGDGRDAFKTESETTAATLDAFLSGIRLVPDKSTLKANRSRAAVRLTATRQSPPPRIRTTPPTSLVPTVIRQRTEAAHDAPPPPPAQKAKPATPDPQPTQAEWDANQKRQMDEWKADQKKQKDQFINGR